MDVIEAGTTDVSLTFALSATGLTVADINVSCVRYDEGDGTSYAVIGPTALTALATITTAHTDNYGIYLDDDATGGTGFIFRVDVPDTYFASGKEKVIVSLYNDGSAELVHRIFRLTPAPVNVKQVSDDATAADNLELACDNYSATRGLSGTALPAAAADGVGGLPISDAGSLDLDTKLANTNEITAARMGALTDWINGGRLDLILDTIAADTTTDIPALIATAQADLDIITGADGVNLLTATQASIDAIEVDTAEIGAAGVGLTNLGGMSTTMKAQVNTEADTALTDYNTTAMTESYATQGATMTPEQSRHMIWSVIKSLKNVNTTTPDSLKIDDTTVAMSFLTDSATAPTEIKRTA